MRWLSVAAGLWPQRSSSPAGWPSDDGYHSLRLHQYHINFTRPFNNWSLAACRLVDFIFGRFDLETQAIDDEVSAVTRARYL